MKDWLINVALAKGGPSAVRGAILGLSGWLAMKNNMVPGVHTDAVHHVTTIAWDQLSTWAIAGLPAMAAGIIKILNHHVATTAKEITQ